MQIDVRIDSAPLILRLTNGQRRLAYAAVNAINSTAKRTQQAEFQHVRESLQIRKPQFFFGAPGRPGGAAARIRPFASVAQGRPYAEIAIQAPEGRGLVSRRTILPIFETGGQRPLSPPSKSIAVPITGGPARPSFESPILPEFTFARLRFVAYRGGRRVRRADQRRDRQDETLWGTEGRMRMPGRDATQWKGQRRTFIAMSSARGQERGSLGAVFQRTGPRPGDLRMVYAFRRPMQLAQRLRWMATARSTADAWFGEEMEREAIKALEHSRGEGL